MDLGIYLVTDRELCGERGVIDTVARAVAGGASVVQYREKSAPDQEQLREIAALADVIDAGVPLLINDRLDLAVAARRRGIRVDGVHLGQDDASLADARAALGTDALIGYSAETIEQITAVDARGADYIGVGAIFATATKTDHPPELGIEGFAALTGAVDVPCVAIGGVKLDHVRALRDAGAAGVAVVSAICAAPDPEATAQEFVAAWTA